MLLPRILTALVGIPIIFLCIYFGEMPFYIMMFVVTFFCVQEFFSISKKYKPHAIVSLVLAVLFFLSLYFFKDCAVNILAFSAILIAFILFLFEIYGKSTDLCVSRIAISFFGAFFLPLALIHMVYIRQLNGGMQLIFFIFIVVWTLDTAAYGFGRAFGKHKLAVNVSPKKTIEGAVAGLIFGVLAAVICRNLFMVEILTSIQAAILGLIIAIVGQFSDLAESLIKRDGQVKDSGKIIPGHGGVFDRFDSYVFVAPAVYYFLSFIK